jgi:hypothetical protein
MLFPFLTFSYAQTQSALKGRACSSADFPAFDGDLASLRVSWHPQVPHAHSTLAKAETFEIRCGCHFFDISPLHSGQITVHRFFRWLIYVESQGPL